MLIFPVCTEVQTYPLKMYFRDETPQNNKKQHKLLACYTNLPWKKMERIFQLPKLLEDKTTIISTKMLILLCEQRLITRNVNLP